MEFGVTEFVIFESLFQPKLQVKIPYKIFNL
jgi:hypothetical protein